MALRESLASVNAILRERRCLPEPEDKLQTTDVLDLSERGGRCA